MIADCRLESKGLVKLIESFGKPRNSQSSCLKTGEVQSQVNKLTYWQYVHSELKTEIEKCDHANWSETETVTNTKFSEVG